MRRVGGWCGASLLAPEEIDEVLEEREVLPPPARAAAAANRRLNLGMSNGRSPYGTPCPLPPWWCPYSMLMPLSEP